MSDCDAKQEMGRHDKTLQPTPTTPVVDGEEVSQGAGGAVVRATASDCD